MLLCLYLLPSAPREATRLEAGNRLVIRAISCQMARLLCSTSEAGSWDEHPDVPRPQLLLPPHSLQLSVVSCALDKLLALSLSKVEALTMATGVGEGGERSNRGRDGFRLILYRETTRSKVRNFSAAQSMKS